MHYGARVGGRFGSRFGSIAGVTYTAPNVVGLTLQAAAAVAQTAGMVLVPRVVYTLFESDAIQSQDIAPGTVVSYLDELGVVVYSSSGQWILVDGV